MNPTNVHESTSVRRAFVHFYLSLKVKRKLNIILFKDRRVLLFVVVRTSSRRFISANNDFFRIRSTRQKLFVWINFGKNTFSLKKVQHLITQTYANGDLQCYLFDRHIIVKFKRRTACKMNTCVWRRLSAQTHLA